MRAPFVALLAAAALSTLAPSPARAFCGFYVGGADAKLFNDATQVVLMRDGVRTVLSMQNNYQGPPQNFAMVVPVPIVLQKENVKTLPRGVFEHIDQLSAPRLVEYWEQDPCMHHYPPPPPNRPMPRMRSASLAEQSRDLGVKVEAQFTVGEYEVVILSAADSAGLERWLHQNQYAIPQGAEPLLRPYVQSGMKFFVAKVDVSKVTMDGSRTMLSPLRFHYDTDSFNLPIRLGMMNSSGTQDLIVHVLARGQRYEVANYENVAIPTNMDLDKNAKASFGAFYAALFDKTMERHPRGVVTEYAWDASTCDPCPGPALSFGDIETLGADVAGDSGPAGAPPIVPRRSIGPFRGGFTLTRLHLRYAKGAIADDLFFRPAPPIEGGREFVRDGDKLEQGARPGSTNNFQARYAIRYPWTGAITCKDPHRGVWGGPPGPNARGIAAAPPPPEAAGKLAFAPRGGVQLGALVKGAIPAEDMLSAAGPTPTLNLAADAGAAEPPAAAPVDAGEPVPEAGAIPPKEPARGGCAGCAAGGSGGATALGWLGVLAAAVGLARRGRRRDG